MFAYFSSSISKCFYLALDSINTKRKKVVNKITNYVLHIWHSFGGGTGYHLRNTPDGIWSAGNVLNCPILLQLHLCLWNSFELIFFSFFLKHDHLYLFLPLMWRSQTAPWHVRGHTHQALTHQIDPRHWWRAEEISSYNKRGGMNEK